METLGLLERGGDLPEHDGMAREATTTICPAGGGDDGQDLGRSTMALATHEQMGGRPEVAERGQSPDQHHRLVGAGRAGPRTPDGGAQGV